MDRTDIKKSKDTAWCPGCGNFGILDSLKDVLDQLGLEKHKALIVGGIGQGAKTPQYLNTNGFCGLHGRAVPAAVGAKMANSQLTVIVTTGDGGSYGEGYSHLVHNIRRNIDITHFVHDNQVYGLTKGQASPTSDYAGGENVEDPLNPVLMAVVQGAGFVARAFSGEREHLVEIMKKAIEYEGYSLVDILQPCVSFNRVNTYKWYSERVYKLNGGYNPEDREAAIKKASEWGVRIPLGVIYTQKKKTYSQQISFKVKEEGLDMVKELARGLV